jgi:hypothetical protein
MTELTRKDPDCLELPPQLFFLRIFDLFSPVAGAAESRTRTMLRRVPRDPKQIISEAE